MKRLIIFLLLFAAIKVAGQTTGYLRFDTVLIYKQGGTAELVLMNKTKDSLGVLVNYYGGRTRFMRSRAINDSTIVVGLDTMTIRGASGSNYWELDGSNNLVNKSFPGPKIEINKRLSGLDSGYVFTSTLMGTNPGEGTGYKSFWHPGKAAFRSGFTDASSFNDAFIGLYSTSFGYNATASGVASVSLGIGTLASGQGSIAFGGSGTQATGNNSTAGGLGSVSAGLAATAFGNGSSAAGASAFAVGFGAAANGSASAAFNQTTRANGDYSAAFGEGSDARTKWGFVAGAFNQTNYSLLIPQFSIGKYSDTTNAAEVFRIGGGTAGTDRRNIYAVDSNGHHIISRPLDGDPLVDSGLVWDNVDQKIKKVAPGSGSGGSDATNTELDLTMIVDTATGGGIDTLGNAYYRYSVTNDKRVEHAVRYTSTAGNNSWDGETEDSAKLTLTATVTDLNSQVYSKGRAYGALQANGVWREMADLTLPNIGIGAYGLFSASYRLPPIITGADVHNSGWSLAAGARYTKAITLSIGTNFQYDYPYVVEIDTVLEKIAPYSARKYLQAVASTALVESTPGSFYNANLTNPVTIHLHTSDGLAPGSSRFRYEVATRRNCISASTSLAGMNIQNLVLFSPGGGYGHIGAATGGGSQMPYISRVIFSGVGTHAAVSQGGVYENSVFLQGIRGLNAGSIGIAFYKDNGTGMYAIARNNILIDQISAFTIHESGSISSKFERGVYSNNYWFSDTTYAGTVFGSEFVKRLDITGNYVFGASSFVTSAADTLNIIGNIIRNISNKSLTATSTPVYSTWRENFFEFTPPNIGSTRSAISSAQTTDSFIVRKNIIHMKSALNIDESQQVLERTATAANPTETDFSNNIIISNPPATRYTKVYTVDQASTEDFAAGMKADSNVYIDLTGNGFIWVNSNPFGGGSPSSFSLADWQSRTDLEPNSIYIDLSANPDGLRDIFVDPDNGNWTLTSSANANLIRALYAGMSTPPTFYPTKPSYEQAVETVLREDNTSPYANWQHGGTYGGTGTSSSAINNTILGSGFQLLNTTSQGIKTLVAGANVTLDSTTTSGSVIINSSGGGGSTDTARLWNTNGNSLPPTALKFGPTDPRTVSFINGNVNREFMRSTGQHLYGDDSTGITATIARVAIKNTADLAGLMIAGATSGVQSDISLTTTHTATANNQSMLGLSIAGSTATGGFTGVSATPISVSHSLPSGTTLLNFDNPGASGTSEIRVSASNGAWRATSAGRAWTTVGNHMITPASANFQIMMEKSFAVVGANFDSSGLNIGDGTRAAARFAIRGSKAQANWGVTGIQMALIAATYTDINTNGTVAHTAINAIAQPTIANVAASTHTNASTLYIANAPAAGTNATLTNPWAVYVAAGKSFLGDDLTITDAAAAQLNLVHTAGSVTGAIRVDGSGNWFFTGSNTSPLFGLGGTTSSFPALIRDGASIQVKLADNSANANLKVLNQAYSESTWDNNDEVPTKNAIRDLTEGSMTQTLWRDFTINTTSGTSESDLYTYTTPANTLSADGQYLEYEISGVLDPTNNNGGINKTLRVYWAGTEVHEQSSTFSNFSAYTARVRVVRVSSANVRIFITWTHGAMGSGSSQTVLHMTNDFATTFSGTNIIKVTGQSANASEQMDVRYGVLRKTP
jgi:hypothetical protein